MLLAVPALGDTPGQIEVQVSQSIVQHGRAGTWQAPVGANRRPPESVADMGLTLSRLRKEDGLATVSPGHSDPENSAVRVVKLSS